MSSVVDNFLICDAIRFSHFNKISGLDEILKD